jgi:hypothetical protein
MRLRLSTDAVCGALRAAANRVAPIIKDMTSETKTQPGPLGFAKMAGSSIAGRDAAAWVTDFLNAAYYRRPAGARDVDDLRLAFSILTTYWYRTKPERRLRLADLGAFHRAFGKERFAAGGRLDREALLRGACALLGDWFPEGYEHHRAWGIAFPNAEELGAYDHSYRLNLARVGALTAESAPLDQQVWHTYPQVEMPSAEGVIGALTKPETWPDYASELGRFTPLRPGGLLGQTFEIEVAAGTGAGLPVFTRGYVTITSLVTPDDPKALQAWFEALEDGMARYGKNEARVLPEGAEPIVGFDLTTHRGHFMGSGHNRLTLYTHAGKTWVKAAGTWDPMPWHLDKAYRAAGEAAQTAFWGDDVDLSMLHQIARAIGR